MAIDIDREWLQLHRLTTAQLRQRYLDIVGEAAHSHNKTWLLKRIAWRLQTLAEGDLSDRARQRAAELARDADLRLVTATQPIRTERRRCSPRSKPRPVPSPLPPWMHGCLRPVLGSPAPTRDKPYK